MKDADRAFVEAIRADEISGATAIVIRTAEFLADGERGRDALIELARACVAAQPAMAGLLTVLQTVSELDAPRVALTQIVTRLRRAPATIARHAAEILLLGLSQVANERPALS